MEFDEKKIRELFKNDRFAVDNGTTLLKVEPGYAEARMEVTPKILNGLGSVMGGAIYTLADFAFAAAANSKGYATVTSNSSINFFKPAKGKFIRAVAKEVLSSNRLCNYTVDIFDEENNFIARYIGNGYILKNRPVL